MSKCELREAQLAQSFGYPRFEHHRCTTQESSASAAAVPSKARVQTCTRVPHCTYGGAIDLRAGAGRRQTCELAPMEGTMNSQHLAMLRPGSNCVDSGLAKVLSEGERARARRPTWVSNCPSSCNMAVRRAAFLKTPRARAGGPGPRLLVRRLPWRAPLVVLGRATASRRPGA